MAKKNTKATKNTTKATKNTTKQTEKPKNEYVLGFDGIPTVEQAQNQQEMNCDCDFITMTREELEAALKAAAQRGAELWISRAVNTKSIPVESEIVARRKSAIEKAKAEEALRHDMEKEMYKQAAEAKAEAERKTAEEAKKAVEANSVRESAMEAIKNVSRAMCGNNLTTEEFDALFSAVKLAVENYVVNGPEEVEVKKATPVAVEEEPVAVEEEEELETVQEEVSDTPLSDKIDEAMNRMANRRREMKRLLRFS